MPAAEGAGEKTTVAVVKVTRGAVAQEVSFDGELRPFEEIALPSRVPGYLQSITVDAGDRVKAGQLLATIDVPELKDDLNRSKAMNRKAVQDVRKAEDEVSRLQEEVKRTEAEIKRAEAAHVEMRSSLLRLQTVAKPQAGLSEPGFPLVPGFSGFPCSPAVITSAGLLSFAGSAKPCPM